MSSHHIVHYFMVNASLEAVYEVMSTAKGLDKWWPKKAEGRAEPGSLLELDFGNNIIWQAQVTEMVPLQEFQLTMTRCDPDWINTRIGFELYPKKDQVDVRFYHQGWPQPNEHYYISNYCWAMYLRVMKRYVEFGEFVAYEQRLNV